MTENYTYTGIVSWFKTGKYGFLERDGDRLQTFVHHDDVAEAGLPTLLQNDRVSYLIVPCSIVEGRQKAAGIKVIA